jgi:hypothetical protein
MKLSNSNMFCCGIMSIHECFTISESYPYEDLSEELEELQDYLIDHTGPRDPIEFRDLTSFLDQFDDYLPGKCLILTLTVEQMYVGGKLQVLKKCGFRPVTYFRNGGGGSECVMFIRDPAKDEKSLLQLKEEMEKL